MRVTAGATDRLIDTLLGRAAMDSMPLACVGKTFNVLRIIFNVVLCEADCVISRYVSLQVPVVLKGLSTRRSLQVHVPPPVTHSPPYNGT